MPPLNWNKFKQLSGSADYNFEMLCRSLIRRHYGRYGQFTALANQPGVEFHLKLHTACTLGRAGDWFGWQCRWYDLPGGRAIGTARRNKIKAAIVTTEKELPDITDWILWTRHPLTKGDQTWFRGLMTNMRLHLWTSAEIEEHLSGEAEIFRGTYFGELVLTPNDLTKLHEVSVAPIRQRWQPEVHQIIDAERILRQMLAESETWGDLLKLADTLRAEATVIDRDIKNMDNTLAGTTSEMASFARVVAVALSDVSMILNRGDLDLLRQQLADRQTKPNPMIAELPRKLRASRNHAALTVTNTLADTRHAYELLNKVDTYLGKKLIAVTADQGCGKTQLAAQLTASVGDRPAGILLYGRDLHVGHNLNDLAGHVIISGTPVPSMEALVAAVDTAGQRARRRLPIVIDGLNEAEDPRDWKPLLASLHATLQQYPYVLVICTLRSAFTDEALPADIERIEMPDFGHDTMGAIRRYFNHYKINAADAELPIELLRHPLTLRLFCEVTNPTRLREVGIEAMPGSLAGLFDRYIDQAAERIAELAPRTRRYCQQDVRSALDQIGWYMWEDKARSLDLSALRCRLGDNVCPWNESIIRALEQDGILLRDSGNPPNGSRVAGVYDMLSGHLVANAILIRCGRNGLEQWLKSQDTIAALTGTYTDRHPLASDIFQALVGLLPRRLHGQQLWVLIDEPLRTTALQSAIALESAYLDAATVRELTVLATQTQTGLQGLLRQLWQTRGAATHPLNANFLDTVIRTMGVAERDLRWTEWIRHNSEDLLDDLQWLEKRWRHGSPCLPADILRARWVMWTLTSTIRRLRDQATRTLYWFGRVNSDALFDLTLDALTINDPYVPERMLAASYGVAMARQYEENFSTRILKGFAQKLYDLMFKKGAPFSTTHILTRDYATHTIEIALLHNTRLLSKRDRQRIKPPFKDVGIRKWGNSEDANKDEYRDGNYPFGFDFNNYTIGYLLPKRHNYDFDDPEYVKVKSNMWWRIYQLGYSLEAFAEKDKEIVRHDNYRFGRKANGGKVDRYGKKYCWIAWHEIAGFRQDKGLLKREWETGYYERFTVDIDPSFPVPIQDVEIIQYNYLGEKVKSLPNWIAKGRTPDLKPYMLIDKIQNEQGHWVLIDGYIEQEDNDSRRDIFIFPRGVFVQRKEFNEVVDRLGKQSLGGRWLPEIPEHHSIFSGEVPWCETFLYNEKAELSFVESTENKRRPYDETIFLKHGRKLTNNEFKELLEMVTDFKSKKRSEEDLNSYLVRNEIEIIRKRRYRIETIQKTRKYGVTIPISIVSCGTENSVVNPRVSAYVLSRELCEVLELSSRPQTFDLYDKNNKRASIMLKWGDEWHTFHKLIYMRKDLLDRMLKLKSLDLIWGVWGERRYKAKNNYGLEEFAKKHKSYKVFQTIITYRDLIA